MYCRVPPLWACPRTTWLGLAVAAFLLLSCISHFVVFPGAAYLETARAACAAVSAGLSTPSIRAARLLGVVFMRPLVLEVDRQIETHIGDGRFEVRSGEPHAAPLDQYFLVSGPRSTIKH